MRVTTMLKKRPLLGFWGLWNISFGFFGIQIAFALQNANVSRIFQTLGASIDNLPVLWIAGPVTGLLVQPLIGYMSDRTWGRLGRRRPYFLGGAIACSLALIAMPNSSALWMAASLLWMLDASINISMEPFRAFVGDMLDEGQRTAGYAFQTVFIGAGAVVASLAPTILNNVFQVSNVAPEGVVPDSVRWSFYIGAIMAFGAVLWTVLTTKEFSPDEMAAFEQAAGPRAQHGGTAPTAAQALPWIVAGAIVVALVASFGLDNPLYILGFGLIAFGLAQAVNAMRVKAGRTDGALNQILSDLWAMPDTMRKLAVIQFLSWFALFILWVYATPIVTQYHFGTTDTTSVAYNEGADYVGVLFAVYNGVAALYAFLIPALAKRIGTARLHAVNLIAGGLGYLSFWLIGDPQLLMLSMVGVGMAWASILSLPYSILCGALPPRKLGVYMGLFNIFIVLPQLVVATVMGALVHHLYPGTPIVSFLIGGGFMAAAAVASLRLHKAGHG